MIASSTSAQPTGDLPPRADHAVVEALLRPDAYPWRPSSVEFVETHISWVFLAGDRVLKVKRPVAYPFLDHRALGARGRSCVEEVRLNRRLTEGVYLAVVPIAREEERLRVMGDGPTVEWGTVMRRLPADRMLDRLLARGECPADLAARLADRLIPFHRDGPSCSGEPGRVVDRAIGVVTANLDEVEALLGPAGPMAGVLVAEQIDLVAEAMRGFLAGQRDRLRTRTRWLRDGHGDLRAEHVCLDTAESLQIFDCVEFSADLRCADVASDLAFLLMDLDRLGAGQVAREVLDRYRAAGFDLPDDLVRCCLAHRALVRVKVAALSAAGGACGYRLAFDAADHLHLAAAAALTVRPALILVSGLAGAGKSTVAAALGRALGVRPVATDAVRKGLAGVAGPAPAGWEQGIYDPAWTERTYRRMLELAGTALAERRPVILDGTFLDPAWRAAAADLARRWEVPLVVVGVACDPAVAERRLAARERAGGSPSDAGLAVHRRQRARGIPPPPAGAFVAAVDTSGEGPAPLGAVFGALRAAGAIEPVIPAAPPAWSGAQAG